MASYNAHTVEFRPGNTLTTGSDWAGVQVDHIDHNRANNDITNLRIVQQEGNSQGTWHGYNHY